MDISYFGLALCVVSFIVVWYNYPWVMGQARRWKVIDNPDARKLQRNPVPVLGGMSVFVGIVTGAVFLMLREWQFSLLVMLMAMGALLVVGILDDKFGLPVWFRFVVEILAVLGMIAFNGNMIDNFHGLFGIYGIPFYVALPLSVFVGVGIINAINLIDGVDGYSSGYIVLSCIFFSMIFHCSQMHALSLTCLICACSLIPFYLHNVFGVKSKMFIGDGGTLMLGTLMTALVFSMLRTGSLCETLKFHNVSLVASSLAILAVPIIDTLRVMTCRMLRGQSPFKPDKTHLHHIFIDLHFSHFLAGFICILLNSIVVAVWFVGWKIGAGVNAQLAIVCTTMVLVDPVLYVVLRHHEKHDTPLYRQICGFAETTNLEKTKLWSWVNRLVDGSKANGLDDTTKNI